MTIAEGTHTKEISLQSVSIEGESYYKITNHDFMRPFFMSIVSDSNHWMFISSNGGLSAGRKDAESALFPYYTDDKITESYDTTGSKTIVRVTKNYKSTVWEPFSERFSGQFSYTRNLYKNTIGNKIIFEEINHDLEVTFRYQWSSSNQYGFIRKSLLSNNSDDDIEIRLVDGIQNIMPYGVNADIQAIRSNLVNAYKRNELDAESGLGIYALSAIIVDRAEPSEALKATTVWSLGTERPAYLLSSSQLDAFRKGAEPVQESDIKAEKGAYFISQNLELAAGEFKDWIIVANVNQSSSDIASMAARIKSNKNLKKEILKDVEIGSQRLIDRVYASDGLQLTADKKGNTRHYSNTLFNIMRGGIFDDNYQIEKWDLKNYLAGANLDVFNRNKESLEQFSDTFSLQEFRKLALSSSDKDFIRLVTEYLPLKFSRRHGDPSRPWNKFSINTRNEEDGSKILDYEGNWRDIFQNWEALALAYPEFIESMIFKFLNASTFDGYNPYRVTKGGFDWEVIEEHDPWSYIGYWGDHQIIYLLKFLESLENHYPGRLSELFGQDLFVYANVPYRIKSYQDILRNPKDTIIFDTELDSAISNRRSAIGSDGALLPNKENNIYQVNFIEKILATALAKLSNFIPEAGIWLNTQRPEWNDANNALVGNGVSMVTLNYLRRFFSFFQNLLESGSEQVNISTEIHAFFNDVNDTLEQHRSLLSGKISDKERKSILDSLGTSGSTYRDRIYSNGFSGKKESLSINELQSFTALVIEYLDHSITANKRDDNMYHAYNLMTVGRDDKISITHLGEMLEGQVAVLSSGRLTVNESLEVLDAMKSSKLFRMDQYSYLLYPNKELPGFINKNVIPKERVEPSAIFSQLLEKGDTKIIECDVNGKYHFNGNFKNAGDLESALVKLSEVNSLKIDEEEKELILQVFEEVFNHKAFTGRSGTFFGYEGLGSIYWHMVSKLLLAVEECCIRSVEEQQPGEITGRLLEHFYEINEGIGVHKSPELYGAFPIDPYSHTPLGKGVQQPGMTGQVKEDILSRMGELGVFIKEGQIQFNPCLLRAEEFLNEAALFNYVNVNLKRKSIPLIKNTLAFTYCQVPVVYNIAEEDRIEVVFINGEVSTREGLILDQTTSQHLFKRTGEIESIKVNLKKTHLK